MIKTYSELIRLKTFEDRFDYLREYGSSIGDIKFGHLRFLNQSFYASKEWQSVRRKVILRDSGCDMGLKDYPILGRIYVHHMNRISEEDLISRSDILLNPEFLICVSYDTHYAITYSDPNLLPKKIEPRTKFDTCPWRLKT